LPEQLKERSKRRGRGKKTGTDPLRKEGFGPAGLSEGKVLESCFKKENKRGKKVVLLWGGKKKKMPANNRDGGGGKKKLGGLQISKEVVVFKGEKTKKNSDEIRKRGTGRQKEKSHRYHWGEGKPGLAAEPDCVFTG